MAEVDTGKGKKGAPRVDLTAMVDLGFLLITFFMLTTTMNTPKAMEVNFPKDTDKPEDNTPVNESNIITIVAAEDDKLYWFQGLDEPVVNEIDYSSEGLRSMLTNKMRENPKMNFILKLKEDATYENMVDVLDEFSITKAERYAIVDITPEDIALVGGETDSTTVVEQPKAQE